MTAAPARKPISFLAFCERIGVVLEPGQLVAAKVCYDGLNPCDLEGEERELARQLFGDVETVPAEARDVVEWVCGRGSGKTRNASLRLVHLGVTVPLGMLARHQSAFVPIVAPSMKQGRECFDMLRGTLREHPKLATLVKEEKAESLLIERSDGKRVLYEQIAASAGGGALRGKNILAAFLEEAAFFRDGDYKVNDEEIYNAIGPRLLPGGQVLIKSSPWVRSGLVYSLHRDNWGSPKTATVVKAMTDAMRSDPRTLAISAREKQRNPDTWRTEFGAEFLDASASQFFDEATLDRCIGEQPAVPHPGDVVVHGGDFGFVHDSSALATALWRDGVAHVLPPLEVRPEPNAPLKPSRVCAEFARHIKKHGGDCLMVDGHYREAVREHLETHDLGCIPAPEGQGGKATAYVKARSLMREGRVKLPREERLLRQLREVTAKPVSGGGLSISSPRGPGGHGDLVSALVLALWQEHGDVVAAARPAPGTPEHDAAEEQRMFNDYMAQRQREADAPWWAEGQGGGTSWADR